MADEQVTPLPDNPWEKAGITEEDAKSLMNDMEMYYNQLDAFIAQDVFDESGENKPVNRRALVGAIALILCKAGLFTGYDRKVLLELLDKSYDLALTAIVNERLGRKEKSHADAL